MSAIFAKVSSMASLSFGYDASVLECAPDSVMSLGKRFAFRREILTAVFIILTLIVSAIYIVEINLIMFHGRKMPALEATLRELEHAVKIKHSESAILYAPGIVKKEALQGDQMVEVLSIKYVREIEAVAANILSAP